MANAKKLPSGSWRVQVYAGKDASGKRMYQSFTAPTKKEAEFLAAEYIYKRKNTTREKLTFQEASDQYIENRQNILSPSTIRCYRIIQRNSVPNLLNIKIDRLADGFLIQRQMNENAKRYSAKSLRNQLGFITAVMGFFKYHISDIAIKPKENHSILVPTKNDAEKIMQLLKEAPDIECQALLAITCSLRQSEIAAITPADIKGELLSVHGARIPDEHNKLVYKETNKSDAGWRSVLMPEYLAKRMGELCASKQSNDWVFDTTPSQVLRKFKRLLISHDMPPYTMHSLRHCFAAIMHARNVPDKYIMEMGGWSSDNVMKKVYQYTFEDETNRAKQQVNQYFDNLISDDSEKQN